ncbi:MULTISPECIES: hypothetical protein [unclassified Thiocapsa]|uniref:hypothetical protein n=1 Tax=unclassified Thiocapsa TaxID=2641286 RepID=UPI0035AEC026
MTKQEAKAVAFSFIRNQLQDLSIALQENFEDLSEEVADELQAEILAQFDHCFGQTQN